MTFDEFAAAELPGLARYARVLTGDRQLAHDVLADALVTAQLHWKRIGTMQHPTAYVRRIVTTTFLGERRRWATRHIFLTSTGDVPTLAAPDPATSVDDRDLLRQMLAGLPRQQRAAIVLRHYLGLTDAEIAAELGCAPVTARSYISRGLATLRVVGGGAESGHDGAESGRGGAESGRGRGGDGHGGDGVRAGSTTGHQDRSSEPDSRTSRVEEAP